MAEGVVCPNALVPEGGSNYCGDVNDKSQGKLNRFYIGNLGNPFTDSSLLTEWLARIDNTDVTDATKIREFIVEANKPAATGTEIEYSDDRTYVGDKTHTIPFKIYETDEKNYAFMCWIEENNKPPLALWYQSDIWLYGGVDGICVTFDMNHIIPAQSEKGLEYFEGTMTWEAKKHPERVLNPFA